MSNTGARKAPAGMEHGKRFVLGHIDLIQNAEAAFFRTLIYGTFAQRNGTVGKGIGT